MELSTWTKQWSHTDIGHTASFSKEDSCVYVEVDGTRYSAAFPDGSSFRDGSVVTPEATYPLDTQTTIGGGAFTPEEARDIAGVKLASCAPDSLDVWLVS